MENLDVPWLDALCRAAITNLPRGDRGVEAAQLFLAAFPEAARRGLGDTTESAPGLFGLLVGLGVIASLPSASAMTAAIRLIAATTELITPRSPRRWTAWFGSARDLDTPLGARLRAQVSPAMMAPTTTPPSRARRRESLQSERDRLANELAAARQDLAAAASERSALLTDRDRLADALAAAASERSALLTDRDRLADALATAASERSALLTDRDRLADELRRTRKGLARARQDLAASAGNLDVLTRERDTASALASERAGALSQAESERDALRQRVDDLAGKLARAIDDLEAKTNEATAGIKSLKDLRRANGTLTEQLDATTKAKRATETDLHQAHADLRHAHTDLRHAEQEAEDLRHHVDELMATLGNIQVGLAMPDRRSDPLLILANAILDRIQKLRDANRQLADVCHTKALDLARSELRADLLAGRAGNARIEDEYHRRLPEQLARARSQTNTLLAPLRVQP